ncbi:MAG: protein FdrA [Acidimicrobiia bacterium]
MSRRSIRCHPQLYIDSVKLLAGSRAILETVGIEWGAVVTGTPSNIEVLIREGFEASELTGFDANDLIMAAHGDQAELAFANADAVMFPSQTGSERSADRASIRSIDETVAFPERPNVAVISVGGAYAVLEAHKAISASMHVLLFSDNVSLEDEIELKRRGEERSLLVMGPGAGTAVIGGIGLGFANAVHKGSIGVVAAAGTGAQEVMSLIDRAGLGVTQVIGVGGRDLSEAVGGRMTDLAIRILENDSETEAILLVSKPPSSDVSERLLNRPAAKPIVAALIGLDEPIEVAPHVTLASDLEEGVVAVASAIGTTIDLIGAGLADRAVSSIGRIDNSRTAIHGLFSGGTLCFEAMTLMSEHGLRVHSNTPLEPELSLDLASSDSHICLDLGEEEYTKGRPHPMIDPEGRLEWIRRDGSRPETAVVLLDVVLGYGGHDDPAGQLAPACAELMAIEGGPQVVAYVLGTDSDPQGIVSQRRQLEDAGCIVAPTNARAALMAIAIATRQPGVSEYQRSR